MEESERQFNTGTSSSESADEVYDVCIVGGGIGGLAAALSLQQHGVARVLLVERDTHFYDRKQGYGLTLTNSLTGPLARLGLLDDCIAKNCPSQSHFTFNAQGEILGYYGRVLSLSLPTTTSTGEGESEITAGTVLALEQRQNTHSQHHSQQGGNRGNLRVPRQELRQLMLDRLHLEQEVQGESEGKGLQGSVKMLWGHKLIDYEESDNVVRVCFQRTDITPTTASDNQLNSNTDKVYIRAYVLVGADGLRSRVRELRDMKHKALLQPLYPSLSLPPLKYLGVSVIIGIAPVDEDDEDLVLLKNKGFYVLDGTHRLFTMPYFSPKENSDYRVIATGQALKRERQLLQEGVTSDPTAITDTATTVMSDTMTATATTVEGRESKLIPHVMWQLSFSGLTESEGLALKNSSFDEILSNALGRVAVTDTTRPGAVGWFPAVHKLLSNTRRSGEVWATPLYDRDDMRLCKKGDFGSTIGSAPGRVTVIGDAAHPMSMFKGQGANMALEDAPLLGAYLATGKSMSQLEVKKRMRCEVSGESESDNRDSERDMTCNTSKHSNNINTSISTPSNVCSHTELITLAGLSRDVISTRIRNIEREMITRASPKVQGSRAAAKLLHSSKALEEHVDIGGLEDVVRYYRMTLDPSAHPVGSKAEKEEVQGIVMRLLPVVREALKREGVTAWLGCRLEQEFVRVVFDTVKQTIVTN